METITVPEPEKTTIPVWHWVLIIISIALIIFFIIWGRQFIQKQYGWGTWTTTQTTPCENSTMSCAQPAKQIEYQRCEPNPLTRRGCLDYNGVQTYATRQKEVDCNLQCRMFKWDIEVTPCQAPDPCTPSTTGGVMGSQTVTYTCSPFDQTGINACTTGGLIGFNGGQYQAVQVYQPGDVVTTTLPCMTTCPVVTAPKIAPTYSRFLDSTYNISSSCITGEPEQFSDLKEGFEIIQRVAELDDTDLPEITSTQIRRNELPIEVLSWPYIKYHGEAYHINLCRYLSTKTVYNIKMKRGWLSLLQTPNNCSTVIKNKNWQRSPSKILFKTPLTWSNQAEFRASIIIAFRRRLTDTDILAQIGIIVDNDYVGWLSIQNNLPYWVQAQMNYISPGMTTESADLIRVRRIGSEIIILNRDETEVWIPSPDAWVSGKNWKHTEKIIFRGILQQI